MSLLDAWVSDFDALVAVDTDGARIDGSRFPASKLLPMPHLNAVLAIRGQAAFLQILFLRCIGSGFDGFDQMADALPIMIEEAHENLLAYDQLIARDCRFGHELVAVGWSHRRERMLGRQFTAGEDGKFIERDLGMHIAPWHSSIPRIEPVRKNVDRIATAQVDWMQNTFPDAACGGQLLTAHVKRDGIDLRLNKVFEAKKRAAA